MIRSQHNLSQIHIYTGFTAIPFDTKCPVSSTGCDEHHTIEPGSPKCGKRAQYRFGKTLGAGTYGIVREADIDGEKVAVKIILKKNVKGNEQMVYDELKMLQSLDHPHIVHFHDWFESRVCPSRWCSRFPLMGTRTNTTLLRNWLLVESCSIEYVIRASSQKETPRG